MVSSSENLYGPYGMRYEAIPHGGHNMFFKDENGQWWSTFFGSDETAPVKERPCLIPVRITEKGPVVAEF